MKIRADYPEAYVKIEKGRTSDAYSYSGFEEQLFTVEISMEQTGFGGVYFHLKHMDVCLPNLDKFVAEFDEFILDRGRTPQLEIGPRSKYDPYLKLSAEGLDVTLEYRVREEYETYHYNISGAFKVDQGYLLEILAGLRDLI